MEWWRRHQKDEKVAALIEDVRRRGVGASRFSGTEGWFSREDRGRGMRFNLWYDERGVRIEPAPLGQGRPCCAGARFF